MQDETESAQAEAQPRLTPVEAVEAWYAQHFHAAAVSGRAPIPADDYAALKAAVAASSQQE